jgi:hypothetical protein
MKYASRKDVQYVTRQGKYVGFALGLVATAAASIVVVDSSLVIASSISVLVVELLEATVADAAYE